MHDRKGLSFVKVWIGLAQKRLSIGVLLNICFGKFFQHSQISTWIPNPRVPHSKPLGGSKVDSAFHLSEVDKMRARNFWELSGKK